MNNKKAIEVKNHLIELFDDAFEHDGFSEIKVEIKILKRLQKEIILHYGKQHRYVVDFANSKDQEAERKTIKKDNAHPKIIPAQTNN